MAEDDIYGSKRKYERFKQTLSELALRPADRPSRVGGHAGKYFCRRRSNLRYFERMFAHFEAKDLSYIRRHRLLQTLRLVCHLASKNLAACDRDDIDRIVAQMHDIYRSPKSKQTFISDLRRLWKVLFPEQDDRGREDETVVPHPVRHLSAAIDKSRQRRRRDRLSWSEFERLVAYFSADPRIQAFLTLATESLARPQELLYVAISGFPTNEMP